MFTTNLNIIIITGTGAGHEPQIKVQGLMRKLSSTVLWLDLNPRTHGIGATRMVFLQSTNLYFIITSTTKKNEKFELLLKRVVVLLMMM